MCSIFAQHKNRLPISESVYSRKYENCQNIADYAILRNKNGINDIAYILYTGIILAHPLWINNTFLGFGLIWLNVERGTAVLQPKNGGIRSG